MLNVTGEWDDCENSYGMLWNGSFLHSTFTTRKVVNSVVNVSMDAEPGVCWRPTLRSDWMTFEASESRRR